MPLPAAGWGGHCAHTVEHPQLRGAGAVVGRERAEQSAVFGNAHGAARTADEVQRYRRPDRGRAEVGHVGGLPVVPSTQPAVGRSARTVLGCHPDCHRGEVRQVRVRVADAVDDADVTDVPQALEVRQVGMQPEVCIERQHLVRLNREAAALGVVQAVRVGHDGVEAVVAAVHHDIDQDALVGSDRRAGPCFGHVAADEIGADRGERCAPHDAGANGL